MAQYTTEVRTICEQFAGMANHADVENIELAIAGSWEGIFGPTWETYDPDYKVVLCRKILRHYWMREIGQETVGLWLHYLRTRMEEIMPYYNQLYKSATLEFNPLHDYELNHNSTRTTNGNTESTEQNSSNSETESTGSSTNESKNSESINTTDSRTNTGQNVSKFSDTPQGMLDNVLAGTYLSSATVDDSTGNVSEEGTRILDGNVATTGSSTGSSKGSTTGSASGTTKSATTEEYVLNISGKTGGKSYSKLLTEFRDTLLNIDKMIIDDLSDLFFGLWA